MRRSDSGAFIRILLSPSSQIACVAACFMFQSMECAFHVWERIFHNVEHAFHNVECRMYPGFVKKWRAGRENRWAEAKKIRSLGRGRSGL